MIDTIRLYFISGKDSLVSPVIRGACMGFPASHVGAILPDDRWISAHFQDGVQIRDAAAGLGTPSGAINSSNTFES